jgi:two-component system, NarL family, response regulator NreC
MEPIKIIIAEDNQLYRDGLAETLNDLPGVVVTGAAGNGRELLALVEKDPPRLVFTDIHMPVMDGIAATRHLSELFPAVSVLALTMYEDTHFLVQMLAAGAKGYLYKECTEEEFARAVEDVLDGTCYYCPATRQRMTELLKDSRIPLLFRGNGNETFTPREMQVIELSCEGYSTKQVAAALSITTETVKKYRKTIVEKVGAKSWVGVVLYAAKHGLVK